MARIYSSTLASVSPRVFVAEGAKATNFTVICEFRCNDRNCPHLIDSFFTMRASLPKSHRKQPARML